MLKLLSMLKLPTWPRTTAQNTTTLFLGEMFPEKQELDCAQHTLSNATRKLQRNNAQFASQQHAHYNATTRKLQRNNTQIATQQHANCNATRTVQRNTTRILDNTHSRQRAS